MELIDKAALVAEIEKYKVVAKPSYYGCGRLSVCEDLIKFLDTLETKEMDLEKVEEKLNKAIKLADAMYNAAQQLTTDASKLHKAMQDWWNFKNIEL